MNCTPHNLRVKERLMLMVDICTNSKRASDNRRIYRKQNNKFINKIGRSFSYCIDVAVAFNMSGNDSKTSLKNLVYLFLNKNIQVGDIWILAN